MKLLITAFILIMFSVPVTAQKARLKKENLKQLRLYEDTLKNLADLFVNSIDAEARQQAAYAFIPKLVKALKTEDSYRYPFDSLKSVSLLRAPDNSFRIFTWALRFDDGSNRFFGAIQMNNKDSLELYPFFDASHDMETPEDSVLDAKKWYGALYYKIIEQRFLFKKYYTLFGWHGNSHYTNTKVADVLYFEKGKPVFGAPLFVMDEVNEKKKVQNRFFIHYKSDAGVSLNYNDNLNMIVYDHLTEENPLIPGSKVPDGTYEGFKWKLGKWRYVEKIFHQVFDEAPVPRPVDFQGQ